MPVFGPNILIILGGSKSSDTHISENHRGTSFLFFCQEWHQMNQKGQYMALRDQNWPTLTTELVLAGIAEKRPFWRKAENRPKIRFFSHKNTPTLLKDLGKGYFFSAHHCLVVARTWFPSRSKRFLGPKNSDFGPQKILFFCYRTLDFFNGPFVALGETVDFALWDLLCDFSFPRYNSFCKKKKNDRCAKKSSPTSICH